MYLNYTLMTIIKNSIAKLNVLVLVRAVSGINLKIHVLASFLFMASPSFSYFSSSQKNNSSLTMNPRSKDFICLQGRHVTHFVYPGVRWRTDLLQTVVLREVYVASRIHLTTRGQSNSNNSFWYLQKQGIPRSQDSIYLPHAYSKITLALFPLPHSIYPNPRVLP